MGVSEQITENLKGFQARALAEAVPAGSVDYADLSPDALSRLNGTFGRFTGTYIPTDWGASWKAALAGSGSSPAVIGAIVDSIGHGYYSSNLRTKGFLRLLQLALQAKYSDGGTGYEGVKDSLIGLPGLTQYAASDPAWATLTGTWTDPGTAWGPGAHALNSTVNGSTITKTFRGTILDIFWYRGAFGTFTYSIDGGAAVPVDTSGAISCQMTTVTGLSAGQHTVVITKTGTTSTFIAGIRGRNASGVRLDMYGQAGQSIWNYLSDAQYGLPADWSGGVLTTSRPSLMVYGMGANDLVGSVTPDNFMKALTNHINKVTNNTQSYGAMDYLIYMPVLNIGTWGSGNLDIFNYAQRALGLAQNIGAAFFDFNSIYHGWANAVRLGIMSDGTSGNSGNSGNDNAHPCDAGHADIYTRMIAALPALLGS